MSQKSPKSSDDEVSPTKAERTGTVREVGSQAIWSLSSCKPGSKSSKYNQILCKLSNCRFRSSPT